ncbi:MAG: class I SAM-dependent methyltransferase [Christensenellales bacterium]
MKKLDPRLRAVVDNISGVVLADVGCDHGKIGLMALKEGRIAKAIESDVSQPSLDKAIKLAKEEGLTSVEFIRCDGFDGYRDNQVDVAVIAGMGGREIVKILDRQVQGIVRYVLLAHSDVNYLRHYLAEGGYVRVRDYVVESGKKFYNLIVATRGRENPSYREIMLGNNSITDPTFCRFVENELAKIGAYAEFVATDSQIKRYYDLLQEVGEEIKHAKTISNN